MEKLIKAMDEIAKLNEQGGKGTTKVQGGKTYTNVSARVEVFRKHLGLEYGIETSPLFPAQGGIFMQAWVKDMNGNVIGSGHAYATSVSKEKGIEKLETTAIGRAMASLGLAGGEYASDIEMESWDDRYSPPPIHMEYGADDVEPEEWMNAKVERLYKYIETPKASLEGMAKADTKTRDDPIFKKIIDEGLDDIRDVYEVAIKDAETKLKKRLEEQAA